MSKDSSSEETKNIPWNALVGVIVAIVALFGSQILISVLLSFYPVIRHWNTAQANNWLNNSVLVQFIFVLLAEIVAVSAVLSFLKLYKGGYKKIGLVKPKLLDPFFGVLGFPAYIAIELVVLNVVKTFYKGLNVQQKQVLGFNNVHGNNELILTFISLVILPPIAEEIIFRGLAYTSLKKAMPVWTAAIVTSLLFAAGHLAEGGSSGPLYIAAIDTFSLSLVLVAIREKTGRLWGGMTLHALKNFIAFAFLYHLHVS
jgi:membrane protease YdiL (CAAX protease family)